MYVMAVCYETAVVLYLMLSFKTGTGTVAIKIVLLFK